MEQQVYNPSYFVPYELPPEQNPQYRKGEKRKLSRIFGAIAVYLFLVAVLQLVASFLVSAFAPQYLESELFNLSLSILPSYLIGFPILWGLMAGLPKKRPEKKALKFGEWIAFLSISFAAMTIGGQISSILMTLLESIRGTDITNGISEQITESSPLMNMIVVVICAPIFEELIFRKLLIDRLLPYSERLAVLTSGLLFGLIHGNFYQFFYTAFLGLILSYVYVKTGKVGYTIVMHMLVNFTGSIIASFFIDKTGDEAIVTSSINLWEAVSVVYSIALYALMICGILFLIRRIRKLGLAKTGERYLTFGTQMKLCWLNAGMIVTLVYCAILFTISLFI